VAISPELVIATGPGSKGTYDHFRLAFRHAALTPSGLMKGCAAALSGAKEFACFAELATASVGFCWSASLRSWRISAVALESGNSFYGGGSLRLLPRAPQVPSRPMLFFWGALTATSRGPIRAVIDAMKGSEENGVNVEFSDRPPRILSARRSRELQGYGGEAGGTCLCCSFDIAKCREDRDS